MTLIIDKDRDQVGTHVLVIGVGRYPHLLEGKSPPFAHHGGMGQLTSPPNSALELANWFATNHQHPEKPLRTLQLLISGTPNTFATPAGKTIAAESATLENIRTVVKVWRDYGNLHEENVLVFYFCGHGVSNGIDQSLLAEDFGSNEDEPFQHAIDFTRFHIGMRDCKAKWQCYLLDACQTVSQNYLENYGKESSGAALVARNSAANLQKNERPVIMACDLGAKAYGDIAKASFFMQALLEAFRGAAAEVNKAGKWEISTAKMSSGVNAFLERILKREHGKEQFARNNHLVKPFILHVLDNQPIVPVDIFCKDFENTEKLAFDCVVGGSVVKSCQGGEKGIWEIDLPPDKYDFTAKNITGGPSPPPREGVLVVPPHIDVEFECP